MSGTHWTVQFPDVARTWHPAHNSPLTALKAGRSWAGRVWWQCPAGHEWQEQINTRLALPAWKNGDRAACRECTGSPVALVEYTYPGCGHTRRIRKEARDRQHVVCYGCHREAAEVRFQDSHAAFRAAYDGDDAQGHAAELAEAVIRDYAPADVPAPLVREFRGRARQQLRYATALELAGQPGAVGNAKGRMRGEARMLVPAIRQAAEAEQEDGVLAVAGRGHWAAGWLYHLTGKPMLATTAEGNVDAIRGWMETHVTRIRDAAGQLSTRDMTGILTAAVKDAARETPGARGYRELSLPVTTREDARFGRLDVVIWHPGFNIAIEIDSANKAESAHKLEFARDAGALAIWVRHGSGGITAPEGVAVIDLREPRHRAALALGGRATVHDPRGAAEAVRVQPREDDAT